MRAMALEWDDVTENTSEVPTAVNWSFLLQAAFTDVLAIRTVNCIYKGNFLLPVKKASSHTPGDLVKLTTNHH